uniref:Putative salivary secreted protein n=1 Tax=Rhodnius neglectus TaxID=72488 RepID=A0A0P4VKN7_9HEMI
MKLLLICSVICCFVLVIFVDAKPYPSGGETVEEVLHVPEIPNVESKLAEIAQTILNLVKTVPGLESLAELGKKGVKRARELWQKLLSYLKTINEQNMNLITNMVELGNKRISSITNLGLGTAKGVANQGNDIVQTSITAAEGLTEQAIGGIDSISSFGNSFTEALKKVKTQLNQIRQMMSSEESED